MKWGDCLSGNRRTLEAKGLIFEGIVGNFLKHNFSNTFVFYNKVFAAKFLKRKLTQVDIIFITNKAIFVIEAKDWSIFIEGDYSSYAWLGMGDAKNVIKAFSPVYQNYLHLRLVKSMLRQQMEEIPPLINLVVVPDTCEIRTPCEEVIRFSALRRRIEFELNKLDKVYNIRDLTKAVRRDIKNARNAGDGIKSDGSLQLIDQFN